VSPSTQLFPEVIDGSTLGSKITQSIFLPIGVEGQMDNDGTAVINTLYQISRQSDASTYFGVASNLTKLVNYLLDKGVGPVFVVPSKKGSAPILAERQAAWQVLEMQRSVRLRLTDSVVTADLTALGVSCNNAALLNNKQVAFVGVATGQTKAQAITVAGAIANSRTVLVAPGVYKDDGTLVSGAYAAASVAAQVAANPDIADDLDTADLPNLLAIEKDGAGNPIFREIVVAGVLVNDFEDLLQGGVSPLQPGRNGGVSISHLRTTYTTDGRWDALMTRLIVDQIFILVRDYCYDFHALRKPNTQKNRDLLASGVDSILRAHNDWISPHNLGDGSVGYGTTVIPSPDNRQQIIHYEGDVNRGTQTIVVDGNLSIAV
jgi:phage tail sheath gpL-like